ncbi:GTPase activating protein [Coprinopsis marcescibilis]|uniref:GTPase activating protein n=1 Tax=Coprinopsis marcescibilis TaxID=230819 RepID=A0A5C3LCS8_COPMA|nr:GTPase activating protein [Coprinopsis marcescibilis]
MSDTWNRYSHEREYLVSVELYVSQSTGGNLRKPAIIRKKPEKRESSAAIFDDAKLRDRSSWQALPKGLHNIGQWRSATCKLSEEGDRCFLNIYVDEAILYQTVYIHLLNQSDIRQTDPSLFFRKDCVALYCIEGQRWTSANTAEPIYIQFPNSDLCTTWLALLRSYAIPEIYGRWFFPIDGGSYRMWRQIELSIVQARNLRVPKTENGDSVETSADADFDGEISCELHLNNILCGRTTGKKKGSTLEWHEKFLFSDLPPFQTLDINVWREKKAMKPTTVGFAQIQLHSFRRGETVEGWHPIIQGVTGPARETQVGELRVKLRVDEEIVLPYSAYSNLVETFNSRNFLDWMTELETKLKLKHISAQIMSVSIANDALIEQIQEFAAKEVAATPISHQTLFRGNTVLTKTIELTMSWYGKAFLEASIGHVLRRLCAEKVAIEVDPMRSGKSTKDVEKNVEQLIYWCHEFWNQIYSVRGDCPNELRRLFRTIRKLVEDRCRTTDGSADLQRDLPKQSVSAFIFLRFIVPAILHPHLFGLCPGLPPEPVQRSLTLIAKVIQSLANLNASSQKESFMRGIKDFLANSLEAMVDYIASVSTPLDDTYSSNPVLANSRHNRLRIVNSLRQRSMQMPVLDKESIPTLPHLLDIPRHLAVITSAIIRSCRDPSLQSALLELKNTQLEELCTRCSEVEDQALFRVTQLAAKLAVRRPSLPVINSPEFGSSPSLPSPDRIQSPQQKSDPSRRSKSARPSTAPSSGSNSPRQAWDDIPSSTISRTFAKSKPTDAKGSNDSRHRHLKNPSTDAAPRYITPTSNKVSQGLNDNAEDIAKKKRGLFRGILKR